MLKNFSYHSLCTCSKILYNGTIPVIVTYITMYLLPKFKIKVNVSPRSIDYHLDFQTKSFKIEYFIKMLFSTFQVMTHNTVIESKEKFSVCPLSHVDPPVKSYSQI